MFNKIVILLICLIFAMVQISCKLQHYAAGVQSDAHSLFQNKKTFFVGIAFSGTIENKIMCEECDEGKFQLQIKLTEYPMDVMIMDKQFYNYYSFKSDSILQIAVSKHLFDSALISMDVRKVEGGFNLGLGNQAFMYLSNADKKWLQD